VKSGEREREKEKERERESEREREILSDRLVGVRFARSRVGESQELTRGGERGKLERASERERVVKWKS